MPPTRPYAGQLLEVTGAVGSVGKDILGSRYVPLTDGSEFAILGVQCFFSSRHDNALARINSGQYLTVRGVCKGRSMNVILKDCELVGR